MAVKKEADHDARDMAFMSFFVIPVMFGIWYFSGVPGKYVAPFALVLIAALFWHRWPSAVVSLAAYLATGVLLVVRPLPPEAPESLWLIFVICLFFPLLFWGVILSEAIGNWRYSRKK